MGRKLKTLLITCVVGAVYITMVTRSPSTVYSQRDDDTACQVTCPVTSSPSSSGYFSTNSTPGANSIKPETKVEKPEAKPKVKAEKAESPTKVSPSAEQHTASSQSHPEKTKGAQNDGPKPPPPPQHTESSQSHPEKTKGAQNDGPKPPPPPQPKEPPPPKPIPASPGAPKQTKSNKKHCEFCVDYKPYGPIFAPKVPANQKLDFVFMVWTQYGEDAHARRQFVRRTWVNQSNLLPLKVRHFFTLGNCSGCDIHGLREEAEEYNDIALFNFTENYRGNMTLKLLVTLNYAAQAYNTNLFIKIDDDTILNTAKVYGQMKELWKKNMKQFTVGKCLTDSQPFRDPKHKWYTPVAMWPHRLYPKYPYGPCFGISKPAILKLLEKSETVPVTTGDDVTIGILAKTVPSFAQVCPDHIWLRDVYNPNEPASIHKKYYSVHTRGVPLPVLEKIWENFIS